MMPMSRRRVQRMVGLLGLYAAMSGFCYSLLYTLIKLERFSAIGYVLWLFGPAATLVYGTQFLSVYALRTAIIIGLALIISYATGRSPVAVRIAWRILVIVWLLFGISVYSPAA